MTDKVQKIREEVERLQKRAEHNFDVSLTEIERQFWLGESNALTLIGTYIDSLQEEPINDAFAKTVGYLVQDVVANEKDAANYANYKRKPTSYFVEKYQSVFGNLIKKAWHRSNEEPKDNSKVIVCQIDDKTKTVLTMEYHSSDKYFHLLSPLGNDYTVSLNYPKVRWAYPEDLLPIK